MGPALTGVAGLKYIQIVHYRHPPLSANAFRTILEIVKQATEIFPISATAFTVLQIGNLAFRRI